MHAPAGQGPGQGAGAEERHGRAGEDMASLRKSINGKCRDCIYDELAAGTASTTSWPPAPGSCRSRRARATPARCGPCAPCARSAGRGRGTSWRRWALRPNGPPSGPNAPTRRPRTLADRARAGSIRRNGHWIGQAGGGAPQGALWPALVRSVWRNGPWIRQAVGCPWQGPAGRRRLARNDGGWPASGLGPGRTIPPRAPSLPVPSPAGRDGEFVGAGLWDLCHNASGSPPAGSWHRLAPARQVDGMGRVHGDAPVADGPGAGQLLDLRVAGGRHEPGLLARAAPGPARGRPGRCAAAAGPRRSQAVQQRPPPAHRHTLMKRAS